MKSKQKKLIKGLSRKKFDDYILANMPKVEIKVLDDGGTELAVDTDGKFLLAEMFDRIYKARTVAELTQEQRDILPAHRKGGLTQKDKSAIIIVEAIQESVKDA